MVATRSSRAVKKTKVEEDVAALKQIVVNVESDSNESDSDDFQEPIPFKRKSNRDTKKTPKESPAATIRKTRSRAIKSSTTASSISTLNEDPWSGSPAASSSSSRVSTPKTKGRIFIKMEDSTEDLVVDSENTSVNHSAAASPALAMTEIDYDDLAIDADQHQDDDTMDDVGEEEMDITIIEREDVDDPDFNVQDVLQDGERDNESDAVEQQEEHHETDSDNEEGTQRNRRGRRDRRGVVRERRGRNLFYRQTQDKILKKHNELKNVWTDLENKEVEEVIPIEQPAELNLQLLPFQKHGVGWMIQQESVETFRGGVLADEMGMGKTIQTISLLLSDKKKPNLVIAPAVALIQWKNEIEKHTNKALSVFIYHGASKNKQEGLKDFDVVLTTYATVEAAFRRQEYGVKKKDAKHSHKEKSKLHKIDWHRIILDEAHNIKDRSSNTARAVFNMTGNYKWSLTGTPLQNRVGELYSLIRFMQADPFAYYYCKACDCKSLTWNFSNKKTCDHCNHTPMNHVCWWNNEILKPIQYHGYTSDGREALRKLRLLLDRIMLRRTKIECADDLGLPPRTVVVRRDIFSEEEEDVYTSLYSDVARQFTTFVEAGTVLNNYANIFELLMKMRQCADHPDLVTKKSTDNKQLVCMLCNDPPEDAIAAQCKHVFCRECCVQYYNSFDDSGLEKPRCPSCYAEFNVDLSQPCLELINGGTGSNANYSKSSIVNRINMDKWRSSTKIEALVEELSKLRREDKTIKSIVFSQFVNFLDLVYWRLSRAGFECIRLDGTMTPGQRDAAIQHFMTKPTCTVFLISLKAGGVALNLTEASRVFICDPWWNPAAELQAMDRIHRLGQHRPIRITRLIIENSIESRIVQLQEKKTALVASTVGKDTSALDKLTVEDLRFLFVM